MEHGLEWTCHRRRVHDTPRAGAVHSTTPESSNIDYGVDVCLPISFWLL